MRIAVLLLAGTLAACIGRHPTYEFEALYTPAIATPSGIKADLAAYAARICGEDGYNVLSQLFVGEAGPSYVHIRFACS